MNEPTEEQKRKQGLFDRWLKERRRGERFFQFCERVKDESDDLEADDDDSFFGSSEEEEWLQREIDRSDIHG